MKYAFLYTGQGFQKPGMLHELPDCREKEEILNAAGDILKKDVSSIDTEEALKRNENTQLCIFLSELILTGMIREKLECTVVCGHSIGSFAAAVTAGSLSFGEALVLVEARGRKMEELYGEGYGMMAVTGLTRSLLTGLLEEFRRECPQRQVYFAAVNTEQESTFSGNRADLKQWGMFIQRFCPAEIRLLKVKVPSHCLLMAPVTLLLDEMAGKIQWRDPLVWYMANTRAKRVRTAGDVRRDLVTGAEHPVLWYESIQLMKEYGIEKYMEVSQAETLCRMGRREWPELKWQSAGRWL